MPEFTSLTAVYDHFVVARRGGLPPDLSVPFTASVDSVPWVTNTSGNASSPLESGEQASYTPLIEAQRMVFDEVGHPYLVAAATAAAVPSIGMLPDEFCATVQ